MLSVNFNFAVAVADRGYNFTPPRMKHNRVTKIRDFLLENDNIFICPCNKETTEILIFGNYSIALLGALSQ